MKSDEVEDVKDSEQQQKKNNQDTVTSIDDFHRNNNSKQSCLSMKSLQSEQNDFLLLTSKFIHNVIRIQDLNGLFLNNQVNVLLVKG